MWNDTWVLGIGSLYLTSSFSILIGALPGRSFWPHLGQKVDGAPEAQGQVGRVDLECPPQGQPEAWDTEHGGRVVKDDTGLWQLVV